MEVKINKDIREFTESIFFGLSMRQFIFSILACGVALLLYFLLKPYFGIETLSWMCILGAVPFAILGFLKFNGMNAEQYIMTWVKSNFLIPSHLLFKTNNYYFETFKPLINSNLKRDFLKNRRENKTKKSKKKNNLKRKFKKYKEVDDINENTKSNI